MTLVGHSVSFDTVGKRTTFGRADATASERASERASGRGDECRDAGDDAAADADERPGAPGENKRAKRARRGRLGERYRDARLGDERRSGASVAARSDWTRSGGRRSRASEGSDVVVEGWETRGTRGGSDGAHGDVDVAGEERDGGRVRVRFAGARGWVRIAARDAVAAREDAMKTDERDARERHMNTGSHTVSFFPRMPVFRTETSVFRTDMSVFRTALGVCPYDPMRQNFETGR